MDYQPLTDAVKCTSQLILTNSHSLPLFYYIERMVEYKYKNLKYGCMDYECIEVLSLHFQYFS